jgi:hypothetical protein
MKKSSTEKKRKTFFVFFKISIFFKKRLTEIIENFGQKQDAEEKPISFLKEQKTNYLPMHLSQF